MNKEFDHTTATSSFETNRASMCVVACRSKGTAHGSTSRYSVVNTGEIEECGNGGNTTTFLYMWIEEGKNTQMRMIKSIYDYSTWNGHYCYGCLVSAVSVKYLPH